MRTLMIAAAFAAASATAPAVAQNIDLSGGLVDVTIQDVSVLNDSLNENELDLLSRNNVAVPITVQVPIGIAANVCGVNANVIAQQEERGDYECDATSGSRALGQQVLRQSVRGNR